LVQVERARESVSQHYIFLTAAAATLAFSGGVLVYLLVSFALVARHSKERPKCIALSAALKEAFWVFVTQPLLPIYYIIGKRMGGCDGGVPVVLVHGYMQNRVDFVRIARALNAARSGPIYGFNYLWSNPVSVSCERLATFVEDMRRAHGTPQVDIVAHSLGGVVALEYVRGIGAQRVRRCVTIASPHAGVTWRGPVIGRSGRELRRGSEFFRRPINLSKLPVPVLSIASTHDNVVHPQATSALGPSGGHDLLIEHLGHLTLLFSPTVIDATVRFVVSGTLPTQTVTATREGQRATLGTASIIEVEPAKSSHGEE
jgi:pimeloyl-ACP methyl ester carboxylesterase